MFSSVESNGQWTPHNADHTASPMLDNDFTNLNDILIPVNLGRERCAREY